MYLFHVVCKRVFDVAVACMLVILLWPILLLTAFLIRMTIGCPVFFIQQRPGLHGKLFNLCKFRTMRNLAPGESMLGTDGQRLTRIGAILRRTSLDELPELWNILKGEMSFVGPRPLLPQYLDRYSAEQARRHDVLPGLTGWAQIHGRNAVDWEERLKLDVWYVDHWSLWLDIKILFKTAILVFSRKGIQAEGQATMSEFRGNHE